ncbi:MAG TPA: hypothetical protein VM554_08645 [Acidisarcina sp.]|nr:hypothetical protein [Acidisarcina sp.]
MRNLTFVFRTTLALLCAGAMLCGSGLRAQTQKPTPTENLPPPTYSLQNDTLAGVRYDNNWQLYFGAGFRHFNAGPNLFHGASLGGPDVQITRRLSHRWAVTGNGRGYWGTSGAAPNKYGIEGPMVSEYLFLGGPEYRGPRNEHAALNFHALVGGARATYDSDLGKVPPGAVGFYNNGTSFAGAFGGSLDLNRSPRWALRISPDMMLTHHGSEYQEQFALSVGVLYRWTKKQPHPAAKKP